MKKGMINVIILALMLVNLVLSAVIIFTFVPTMKKTSQLIDKVCKIVDLDVNGEGKGDNNVSIEDLEYVQIIFSDGKGGTSDSQVFNLKQSGSKVSHIKLAVTLAVNKKHDDYKSKISTLNSSMTYIGGQLGDIMLEYTATEANSNKKNMENRVQKMLRELFESDFIYDVSFTQFVISQS